MYSLHDYGRMIADADRVAAYSRAISNVVHPGHTVAEIGCGPALFAMLACGAGAKRVYAIESEPIIDLARRLANANGLGDHIVFLESDSRKISLPERVDVIVSDVRGVLPLFGSAISVIEDARQRFLAPGGVLIPARDALTAGVVEADRTYRRMTSQWRRSWDRLDLSGALTQVLNTPVYGIHFRADQLLTNPATWFVLDYLSAPQIHGSAEIELHCVTNGVGHGICVWFETRTFGEYGYSTGPGTPKDGISGQMFLPWPEAVSFRTGEVVELVLTADLLGSDYVWQWETRIPASHTRPERHFQQSTFQGDVLSPASLRRRAADFVPTLSPEGQADRWLLLAMDGKVSLQEIAHRAAQQFPKIFPRWEDALRRAADLATQFSR